MYVVTSYLMIHSKLFGTYDQTESVVELEIDPSDVLEDNWTEFIHKNNIRGRLTREDISPSGEITREYSSVSGSSKINVSSNRNLVTIRKQEKSLTGTLVGFHRQRGYQGPPHYTMYAVMLDLVGVNLMIFAITGMVLWLKLLKNNGIAWAVLLLGLAYVTAIVVYLMTN
jgi:hypothetical protein